MRDPAADPKRRCRVCSGVRFSTRLAFRDFAWLDCGDCGTVVCSEQPDRQALSRLYGEAYFKSRDSVSRGYDDYLADRGNILRTSRRRLELLARHGKRGGRLLDVGCAAGFFLEAAREAGFQVRGLELSAWAAERARQDLGLEVVTGTLCEAGAATGGPFDAITLWDVLEHFTDPAAELRAAAALLAPDGLLALMTPNTAGLAARLFGRRWVLWKKPAEHVHYFSPATLRGLLARAGLALERVYALGYGGKHVSLAFVLGRVRHYWPRASRLAERGARAARVLDLAFYADWGDNMVAIARHAGR